MPDKRKWMVTFFRSEFPLWRCLNLGVHVDLKHPMAHLHFGQFEIRIGRHYILSDEPCANDPYEWKERCPDA